MAFELARPEFLEAGPELPVDGPHKPVWNMQCQPSLQIVMQDKRTHTIARNTI
jgi:hypothetical protein